MPVVTCDFNVLAASLIMSWKKDGEMRPLDCEAVKREVEAPGPGPGSGVETHMI